MQQVEYLPVIARLADMKLVDRSVFIGWTKYNGAKISKFFAANITCRCKSHIIILPDPA